MKRTQKQIIKNTEDFLNERWMIAHMEDARPQELSYYNGACKALVFAGFEWSRDENGKHTVYRHE